MKLIAQITVGIAITMSSISPLVAQINVQQVEGSYLGLVDFGDTNSEIVVELDEQLDRRFVGQIPFESDEITLKGTIAASDECKIVFDAGDGSMSLDWEKFGGGAALLKGEILLSERLDNSVGSVGLLRPYDNLGVDWSVFNDNPGAGRAVFESVDGTETQVSFGIDAGETGLFHGFMDPDVDLSRLVGTSNTDDEVVIFSLSPDTLLTVRGRITSRQRGVPRSIEGTYTIHTRKGKLIDMGLFNGYMDSENDL